MVSIKDVAKEAGVAISTVSKVLNHYPNVSESTKQNVRQAIAKLHYVPNTIAAALSSKQSGRVALLMNLETQTQAIDEIGMQYLSGAICAATELEMDVITVFFSMIQNKPLEEIVRYFQSQNITGIVIYGISKKDRILTQLIDSEVFKIVVVDAPLVNASTSCVWIDYKRAQYDIARKTITENHAKRILYLAGKREAYPTNEQISGIQKLVREQDLTLLIREGRSSELEARKLTYQYGAHKDIIVCATDLMAIGAMKALMDMDIFRPVCGFDGIILMGYVGKQMNTVKQNFYQVSGEAVREVHRLMADGQGKNIVLDYNLVRMRYIDIIC
ncbi:MAG: LacI family DNA-binding transcriptional regulator [Lachnospiraceae bacterium]